MELDLSAVAVYEIEKNKIATTGAWLILLEIQYEGVTIRIVNNTENIEWPTGSGQIWHRFPFRLGEVSEDRGGEIPQFTLRVSNVHRTVGRYLEQYRGGTDATAIIRVVHSKHLDNPKPVIPSRAPATRPVTASTTTATATWTKGCRCSRAASACARR